MSSTKRRALLLLIKIIAAFCLFVSGAAAFGQWYVWLPLGMTGLMLFELYAHLVAVWKE